MFALRSLLCNLQWQRVMAFCGAFSEIEGIEVIYTISAERRRAMAFYEARDFLFCGICSTTLSFTSPEFASCPVCGFMRSASEIEGIEVSYTISAEDIRRELQLKPFVVLETAPKQDETVKRAVVNESCPKCQHPQLEYYTKQLRSADEGQTVFYECPECRYKFSQNT